MASVAVELQHQEFQGLPSFSQAFPLQGIAIALNKRARCQYDSDSGAEFLPTPSKKYKSARKSSFIVKAKEIEAFFSIIDDPLVSDFLVADGCRLVTDKYLLAMVFVYFKRAGLKIREYTKMNFFLALYLASDMEEDEEEHKYEIFPWALGKNWKDRYMSFLGRREKLWARLDFRAIVSKKCCEEVMKIHAEHWIWKRTRNEHHSGAQRPYKKDSDSDDEEDFPRGPGVTPKFCNVCDHHSIEYDSASPDKIPWFLSSSSESSPEDFLDSCTRSMRCNFLAQAHSRFDMKGLRLTLQEDDGIWAHDE